jgi:hypothetical protein
MKRCDAVPDAIIVDEYSKRETVELCGNAHDGQRCVLLKGHDGMHESLARAGSARWSPTRS